MIPSSLKNSRALSVGTIFHIEPGLFKERSNTFDSHPNPEMKTKRGKKVHTTKKGLGRIRTRPDDGFQMKRMIRHGLQDYDDHVPSSSRHSWTLSSSMSGTLLRIYASLYRITTARLPQQRQRLCTNKKIKSLPHFCSVCGTTSRLLWIAAAAFLPTVLADQNVTVDDQDPSIVYSPPGAWALSANSSLDFGGAHMLTQNPNGTAVFNFTGSC